MKEDINRFARQVLEKDWDQSKIARAKIIVVGAGAVGNEVIKNLTLIGVKRLLIVDFDCVAWSNLSRCVLFRETDIGQSKALAAAQSVKQLYPQTKATHIHGDAKVALGLGLVNSADVVIAAVDNIDTRIVLAEYCELCSTPLIDLGIWSMGGEIRRITNASVISLADTFEKSDLQASKKRMSCEGLYYEVESGDPAPTNVIMASLLGAMGVQEALREILQWPAVPGDIVVYNGITARMHQSKVRPGSGAPKQSGIEELIVLQEGVESLTLDALFEAIQEHIKLNGAIVLKRDLIMNTRCKNCLQEDQGISWLLEFRQQDRICSNCGAVTTPRIVNQLLPEEEFGHLKLSELKIPPGEIFTYRTVERDHYFLLNSDVESTWK